MRLLILTMLVFSVCFASESQFTSAVFSINAPSGVGNGQGTVTMMFLPAKNKFAGNVNVAIQDYVGTIKEYDELSQAQFKQMGFSVLDSKLNADSAIYEYEGKSGGFNVHWYSRAVKLNKVIYLITATGLAMDWPDQKVTLMESVDSFKFIK